MRAPQMVQRKNPVIYSVRPGQQIRTDRSSVLLPTMHRMQCSSCLILDSNERKQQQLFDALFTYQLSEHILSTTQHSVLCPNHLQFCRVTSMQDLYCV